MQTNEVEEVCFCDAIVAPSVTPFVVPFVVAIIVVPPVRTPVLSVSGDAGCSPVALTTDGACFDLNMNWRTRC